MIETKANSEKSVTLGAILQVLIISLSCIFLSMLC